MLKAYLHTKKKPNERHWYAYDVAFDGEILVTDSATRSTILPAPCLPEASRAM